MSGDKKIGDINVSMGDGNTVGDIGHRIVVGKVQRHITDDTRQGLRSLVPRDREVLVLARQGDRESQNLADEIYAFLKGEGYAMADTIAGWHQFQTQRTDINVSTLTSAGAAQTAVVVESAQ